MANGDGRSHSYLQEAADRISMFLRSAERYEEDFVSAYVASDDYGADGGRERGSISAQQFREETIRLAAQWKIAEEAKDELEERYAGCGGSMSDRRSFEGRSYDLDCMTGEEVADTVARLRDMYMAGNEIMVEVPSEVYDRAGTDPVHEREEIDPAFRETLEEFWEDVPWYED